MNQSKHLPLLCLTDLISVGAGNGKGEVTFTTFAHTERVKNSGICRDPFLSHVATLNSLFAPYSINEEKKGKKKKKAFLLLHGGQPVYSALLFHTLFDL